MALVNRNAGVDAGRKARADPSDAAPGLTPVADEIALCAGPGPNSVGLAPSPETRRVARPRTLSLFPGLAPSPETRRVLGFGRAAPTRIVAQRAAEPV